MDKAQARERIAANNAKIAQLRERVAQIKMEIAQNEQRQSEIEAKIKANEEIIRREHRYMEMIYRLLLLNYQKTALLAKSEFN